MDEVISYSFAVDISKNEDGKYVYGVFQEFVGEDMDDTDLELLESGEADTLKEAADMAGRSIKTLFSV